MNIWRKWIAVCLALAMALSLLPTAVLAADTSATAETTTASTKEITPGTCGDNLTWNYDADTETLTITGAGAMTSYDSYKDTPWYGLSIQAIKLPNGITNIGSNSFQSGRLQEIEIPDSVTTIGDDAFAYCYALTEVTVPNGVTDIGDYSFYRCEALKEIEIPDSVTRIGKSAFSSCTSLTTIDIPDSVTSIGDMIFYNCPSLASIKLSNGITSIGNHAFSGCTSLTTIEIPEGVTSIGTWAFFECSSLNNVVLPNGVTNIKYAAFLGCSSLENVVLPSSLTTIGERAFSECNALTGINIPNNVTSIEKETFYKCSTLSTVVLPESLTSIGADAFSYCSSLTNINIPDTVTYLGGYSFYKCSNLEGIRFGTGLNSIKWNAFSGCSSLKELKLPKSVTDISYNAFENCTSLQTVELPQSLELIEHSAFLGDEAISEVVYAGTQSEWEAVEVEEENENLTNAHFTFLNNGMVVLNDLVQYVPYQGELGASYQLKAGAALPEGLALNEAGTTISGVPQVSGTFTVTLVDQEGAEKTLQLVIAKPSDAPEGNKTDAGYEWNNNPPSSIKTGEDLVLISEGDISQFQTVYLDGVELVRDTDYTAEAGSTKLTIYADALKKVGTGAHTISVAFDAQGVLKTASYTVTVKSSSSSGSSSGSSSPSYDLKVSADVEHGSVKLSRTSARKGVTVSITVTPDAGYTLGTISAKDENGNEVALSESDGQYTFTMPGSDVTVSASFIQKVYGVTADAQVENGTIALEQTSAAAGVTVSFTLLPDSGCLVQSVQVADETGTQVEIQETAGQYSFVMPEDEVHISVSFQRVLPFQDVWANQWYWDEICYMYQNNIMNGTGADRFQPESVTTQGMVVTTLYRMAGSPAVEESLLDSASKSAYYALPVAWGQETQMMAQFAAAFDPDDIITREQMAVMLYNYVNYMGVSTAVAKTDLSEFNDGAAASEFALPAMLWACETGMLQGYNGALRPQGQLTRAELATVLMRLDELVKGQNV